MTVDHARRELDCDLLVVGGGAAGLAGAVTAAYHGLKVIVAEKAPVLGGATSWSGGWMWAPLNPLSQADGIVEDIEAPRTYLKHALGEDYDEARVDALLQNARHMVAFFEKHTALQFVSGTWIADIQGDLPGAGTGGRSVGPKPINMRRIKKELRPKLRSQLYETSFLGMGIMAGPDLQAFLHATTSIRGFFHAGVAGRVPRARPDHQPPGHAAGQRHRPDRSFGEVGRRPRRAAVGELPGDPAAHRGRGRDRVPSWPPPTGRSPSRRGAACCWPPAGSPTTSTGDVSCSPAPPLAASTGRWPRRRPPVTGSPWASRSAGGSTRRWPHRRRGARCRWCPTATGGSAPTRTSWTAASPG